MPTISVIATVLNESGSIEELVRSLAAQSLTPSEIVIVDGGSTDGTWEKLEQLSSRYPLLKAIRDESCNLRNTPGPIARGRNVAIAAARGEVIACCDAGCSYAPDWLSNLTAPMADSGAQYVLGGSRIDLRQATAWDIAAAPLMGISTSEAGTRRSCTARSMAFTKELWHRAGKFPETTLLGEDTWFDLRAGELVEVSLATNAMAIYRPQLTFSEAANTIARYAAADGALGLRRARFRRMLLRCFWQVLGVATAWWTWKLLAIAVLVELIAAFERDRTPLKRRAWRAFVPRIIFSVAVPWIVVFHYWRARITRRQLVNRQNA